MDILIKGMEMKDYPQSITINPDGSVVKDTFGLHRPMDEWKAVALPEHGDLKDETDIIHRIEKIADADLAQDIIGEILASPTIVEASR